jgi:hypothetical protein
VRTEERFGELHEQIWGLVRTEVEDQLKAESKGES